MYTIIVIKKPVVYPFDRLGPSYEENDVWEIYLNVR